MLNSLMNNWSESYIKQANLMELDMTEFFHYIQSEFSAYKEVRTISNKNSAYS